jgi:hypothetical protein
MNKLWQLIIVGLFFVVPALAGAQEELEPSSSSEEGLEVIGAQAASSEAATEQEVSTEASSTVSVEAEAEPEKGIGLSFAYGIDNTLGVSTFVGRPSLQHRLRLSSSYKLTEQESLGMSISGNGEFFTSTNGNTEHAFINDIALSLSSGRIPGIEFSDSLALAFSPSLTMVLPTSPRSLLVSQHQTSWSLGTSASLSWKGFSLSLSPSLSYTFYKYVDQRFANKEEGDDTQEGSLNAPLSLSVSTSVGYRYGKFSASSSYGVIKSLSYANTAGDSFWRDYATFSLGARYSFHPLATVGLRYGYGADPLDGTGSVRIPFFSSFADWNNTSRFYITLSGSYSVGQSIL